MSTMWVIGSAVGALTVTAVVVGTVADVGNARTAAPARATTTHTTPKAKSAKSGTLSLAATKKLATAAASSVSPALVDLVAATATGPSAGTGIVLTAAGEVLTNFHVVRGAGPITATVVNTGRAYPATLVGYDAADDIAVLQLAGAAGLPTARLARTAATVGQSVFAVGNANGVGGLPAWASGAVTATNRSVVASNEHRKPGETLTGMLQTTTPIVPGYSGGALVNQAGEVVGMNTCGSFSVLGKPATAGFAIPIAKAVSVANTIVEKFG